MKQPICIMAGGTGGHIFPGLAVAEELIKRGETVHWIGSKHGLEGQLVPEKQIPIHYLLTRKFLFRCQVYQNMNHLYSIDFPSCHTNDSW